jgi:hypothetical protein
VEDDAGTEFLQCLRDGWLGGHVYVIVGDGWESGRGVGRSRTEILHVGSVSRSLETMW